MIVLTHNELIDFLKNKRILTYEIHIDVNKVIKNMTSNRMQLYNIYLENFKYEERDDEERDKKFRKTTSVEILDCYYQPVQQFSRIRNYFLENFEYNFNNYFNNKKVLSDNFNNSVFINFFIPQETNLVKNLIIIKTFDPNLVNEFILFFVKKANIQTYLNSCITSDADMLTLIKISFIDQVFNQSEILKTKNIYYNNALDTDLSKQKKIKFFGTEDLAKLCEFLDNQLNKVSNNYYTEKRSYVYAYNEIKKLENNISMKQDTEQYIKISKKLDKRLFDFYKFMSSIILCLFIIFITETIYKRLIHK
jgi:hypothetical protein